MAHNGEINQRVGVYKTVCCGTEIVINAGVAFPDCPRHPKLTTIWKAVIEECPAINESEGGPLPKEHVENRRLLGFAAGRLRLNEWEGEHLRECRVCQAIVHVFLSQPLVSSPSTDAA